MLKAQTEKPNWAEALCVCLNGRSSVFLSGKQTLNEIQLLVEWWRFLCKKQKDQFKETLAMSHIWSREFWVIQRFGQQQFTFSRFQAFKKWRKVYEWKNRWVEKEWGLFIFQKLNLCSPAMYCIFHSLEKLPWNWAWGVKFEAWVRTHSSSLPKLTIGWNKSHFRNTSLNNLFCNITASKEHWQTPELKGGSVANTKDLGKKKNKLMI